MSNGASEQANAQRFINSVLHEKVFSGEETQADFKAKLKDGVIICKVLNALKPGSVEKINESKMPFKMMENIGLFIDGCRLLGMTTDLFQIKDLYEGENIPQVIKCLNTLEKKADELNLRYQ